MIPVCALGVDNVEHVTLYPATLGQEKPRPRRGCPTLTAGAQAERILTRLQTLSEPYGTQIRREESLGSTDISGPQNV
jgi:poly-gamma-glutamate synthesis protein (capsule biosynthesis protein)